MVLDAREVPLAARVERFALALSQLYVAGLGLPPASAAPPRQHACEPPSDFPGLHPYDRLFRLPSPDREELPIADAASYAILDIYASLWPGMEHWQDGQTDQATARWSWAFEEKAGQRILDALPRLHVGVRHLRADARPRRRGYRTADSLVMLAEAKPAEPGVIGVRLAPAGGGAVVLAIHPAAPARDVLTPGDLLLEIAGKPLDGLDEAAIGALLAGPAGVPKACLLYRDGESFTVRLVPVPASALVRQPD